MLFLFLIMLPLSVNSQEAGCEEETPFLQDECKYSQTKILSRGKYVCCTNVRTCLSKMHFGCGYNETTKGFTFNCTEEEKSDPSRFADFCPIPREMEYMREAAQKDDGYYYECKGDEPHNDYECRDAYNVGYNGIDRSAKDGEPRKFFFEKFKKSHLYEVLGGTFIYSDENTKITKDIPFASVFAKQVKTFYDIPEQLHLLPVGYLENMMITNCAKNSDCGELQFCGTSITANHDKYCYHYPPVHISQSYRFKNSIHPDGVELPVCRDSTRCGRGQYCVNFPDVLTLENQEFWSLCLVQRSSYQRPQNSHDLELGLLFTFTVIATLTITVFMGILVWTCIEQFVTKGDGGVDALLEEAMPSESEVEMDTEHLRTGE